MYGCLETEECKPFPQTTKWKEYRYNSTGRQTACSAHITSVRLKLSFIPVLFSSSFQTDRTYWFMQRVLLWTWLWKCTSVCSHIVWQGKNNREMMHTKTKLNSPDMKLLLDPFRLIYLTQCCSSPNNGCSQSLLSGCHCSPAATENDFQQLDQINWLNCWAKRDR